MPPSPLLLVLISHPPQATYDYGAAKRSLNRLRISSLTDPQARRGSGRGHEGSGRALRAGTSVAGGGWGPAANRAAAHACRAPREPAASRRIPAPRPRAGLLPVELPERGQVGLGAGGWGLRAADWGHAWVMGAEGWLPSAPLHAW